jgi:hypothetical protein
MDNTIAKEKIDVSRNVTRSSHTYLTVMIRCSCAYPLSRLIELIRLIASSIPRRLL